MSDKYKIDSHKLIYHPQRVTKWLETGDCYPIYVELGPSGMCNHRCTFCGLDFVGYKESFLSLDMLSRILPEISKLGVQSILHSGEGEPLLNKDLPEIIKLGKDCEIDQAMATNAALLTPDVAKKILPYMEWIKVSIAAGRAKEYSDIHKVSEQEFDKVIYNIAEAVKIKKENNYKCTVGMQMLLLPENMDTAITLAEIGRDIGVDYLVIKPFSQQLASINTQYNEIKYTNTLELSENLSKIQNDDFSVVFRAETIVNWNNETISSKTCYALPFWAHIDSTGNVWGCGNFLHDDRFNYGNINDNSFKDIWNSKKRKQHLEWIKNDWNTENCRINCRMNKINSYLNQLKNPIKHVNYI